MVNKYRVHEVAKDFSVPSKDVIDLLAGYFSDAKKHMTVLTDDELNLVFDHYTQKNMVSDLNELAKAQADAQKAVADVQKATADAQKAAAAPPKPEAPKAPEPRPQAVQPPGPVQAGAPQVQRAPQAQQARPVPQAQQARPAPQRPPQQSQKQKFEQRVQQAGTRPAQQPATAQRKPQPQAQRPQSQILTPRREAGAGTVQKDAAVGTPVRQVMHVDFSGAHVEIDKYNDRYEQIGPANFGGSKDNVVKKQKLNQRSARKGKPKKTRFEIEAEKMRRLDLERQRRQKLEITLPEEISVGDLALKLKVQASEIIKKLMQAGTMASISDIIDYDTAALVAMEIGAKVEREVVVTIEDRLIDDSTDTDSDLIERSPVVVVMGHVDHGKTSLLDAIRNENVTASEAGGITQHIGAYQVEVNGRKITFLDTPGHAAFTSMRARGAQITDIAVLVVAADDGIMPQTIEAINHAKAAEVGIIVAINKMDKPAANPNRVKQELTEHGLVIEEWGGDVICVEVSALEHKNIDTLLEMIQLAADMRELKANPDRKAKGTIIEARLDKGRGPIATVLVQNGTLVIGDIIIAGTAVGRVRTLTDDKGNPVESAGPSMPVEITGLADVPSAGDIFNAVEDERLARELVEERRQAEREVLFSAYNKVTLDNLFSHIEQGEVKELPLIVKADVQGSVEALKQSLEKLSNDEIRVKVIHGGVGAVSESDVMLADASNAIIIGFNVRPDPVARDTAARDGVDIRSYRVIYDAINEITDAMKGMLAPKFREIEHGRVEVRAVYKITGSGIVAGCYVTEGKVTRASSIRIVRDGIIVGDAKIDALKRFKDDVKEVASGYECGISLVKHSDIKEGDIYEAYEIQEYRD